MKRFKDNTPYRRLKCEISNISIKELKDSGASVIYAKKDVKFYDKHFDDKEFVIKDKMTKNYIGEFVHNGKHIKIVSRFGDLLLKKMLERVDSALFKNLPLSSRQPNKNSGDKTNGAFLDMVLYLAFVKFLKQAKLNGFPAVYKKISHRDSGFSGSLDINKFIKKDIPFTGKISYSKSELVANELITDVLLKAYNIAMAKFPNIINADANIRKFLLSYSSGGAVDMASITRAMNSKALLNPLHSKYKRALELARIIILKEKFTLGKTSNSTVKGLNFSYLLYVPELFEGYIERLIRETIAGSGYELKTQAEYRGGKLRPDFVLKNGDDKIVIDAKYRHFYKKFLCETDCKDLRKMHLYLRAAKSNTGILIYAKSNINKMKYENKGHKKGIFIMRILDNKGEIIEEEFKTQLEDILNLKEQK